MTTLARPRPRPAGQTVTIDVDGHGPARPVVVDATVWDVGVAPVVVARIATTTGAEWLYGVVAATPDQQHVAFVRTTPPRASGRTEPHRSRMATVDGSPAVMHFSFVPRSWTWDDGTLHRRVGLRGIRFITEAGDTVAARLPGRTRIDPGHGGDRFVLAVALAASGHLGVNPISRRAIRHTRVSVDVTSKVVDAAGDVALDTAISAVLDGVGEAIGAVLGGILDGW